MRGSVHAEHLGKHFTRRSKHHPKTVKEFLMRGWRTSRPPNNFWALRGVSFLVEPGQMLGVIGHNGSGKSTLLRLLGGVMQADEGRITANGRVSGLLELNTGMHPDLSGRENIIINAVVAGLTRREALERMEEVIAFAQLKDFIDNPVRTYSSGMKLRLGFAVAAHVEPGVLLIDEVLSVGDLAFQQKCLDRIGQFKQGGCAIVFVSHDLAHIEKLCDRVIWLHGGEVVVNGDPSETVANYRAEMMNETRRRTPADVAAQLRSGNIVLQTHRNRFGSLEVEISAVRLFDFRGEEVTKIMSGDSLKIDIDFKLNAPVSSAFFTINIGNSERDDCVVTNTGEDGVDLPALSQVESVTLQIDRLDLPAGDYWVSVGVFETNWSYAYDYHWRAYPFSVSSERLGKGQLDPPRHWAVRSS
jgi:lipopolysaccharide transport system ATP-binding protein